MKEFLLVFRRDSISRDEQLSPEQMQAMMKPWSDWLGGLAAQNKLVASGNRLEASGKVVKPAGVVINGPYVEVKEAIGGYSIVRATSIDEATVIAQSCPILMVGGSVEVRPIVPAE